MKNSIVGAKAQLVEDVNAKVTLGKSVENDKSQKFKIKGDNNQLTNITINITPTVLKEMLQGGNNEETNKALQTVRDQLETELNAISEEKRTTFKEANMGVIKESIDNYYLNWNKNELRDYWKKIIINSFDKDKSVDIHPSFIKIIQSLSTEEARLLNKLVELFGLNFKIPVCSRLDKYKKFVDANGIEKTNNSFYTVHTYYTNYFIAPPEKQAAMISNLVRLGIFEKPSNLYMVKITDGREEPIDAYKEIQNNLIDLLKLDEKNCKYEIVKSQLSLTPFGKKLLSIVHNPKMDYSKLYSFK